MNKILNSACLTVMLLAVAATAQDETSPANATVKNAASEQDPLAEGGAVDGVVSFQASLTPTSAIYDRNTPVEGMTLSLWGENPQKALAIGIINGSTGASGGLSVGFVNYADSFKGAQWAFVNCTEQDFTGWQGGPGLGLVINVVNYVGGRMKGLQTGLVNIAGTATGLQLGVFNYAAMADSGVQVGLVNIIAQNRGWFSQWPDEVAPGMVLVNWHF